MGEVAQVRRRAKGSEKNLDMKQIFGCTDVKLGEDLQHSMAFGGSERAGKEPGNEYT